MWTVASPDSALGSALTRPCAALLCSVQLSCGVCSWRGAGPLRASSLSDSWDGTCGVRLNPRFCSYSHYIDSWKLATKNQGAVVKQWHQPRASSSPNICSLCSPISYLHPHFPSADRTHEIQAQHGGYLDPIQPHEEPQGPTQLWFLFLFSCVYHTDSVHCHGPMQLPSWSIPALDSSWA